MNKVSKYDYRSFQLKKTRDALRIIFTRLGVPLTIFYWFTLDLYYHPEHKWILLAIRLTIIPIAIFCYSLFKFKFFLEHFLLPVILGSILSSVMSIGVLYYYIDVAHSLSFIQNLFATASLVFLPLPFWAVLVELVLIYFPYMLVTIISHPQSSYIQIYSNFNSFIGFIVLIFCIRHYQSKRDKEDFANRQSLLADAKIGENIAQISHDTRAPLMALKTIQSGEFDKDLSKDILTKSIGRLIELVEDITQSASSLHLNIQPNDLRNLFGECKSYVEFLHPERKFIWELKFNASNYSFDKNKIKRVIINLVNNSVKATALNADQTVTITATCGEKFFVKVADHGKGFDSKINIFKKGTSKFGSSGLGLHFCKQVIQEHGGEITGKSGDGTTEFSFII